MVFYSGVQHVEAPAQPCRREIFHVGRIVCAPNASRPQSLSKFPALSPPSCAVPLTCGGPLQAAKQSDRLLGNRLP
jgi:hypothetical protein